MVIQTSYSGVPIFQTAKGNENWFEKSVNLRNWGVKLQCSTEEGKQLLVRVFGGFEKTKVREIAVPLYVHLSIVNIVCTDCIYANSTGLTGSLPDTVRISCSPVPVTKSH